MCVAFRLERGEILGDDDSHESSDESWGGIPDDEPGPLRGAGSDSSDSDDPGAGGNLARGSSRKDSKEILKATLAALVDRL